MVLKCTTDLVAKVVKEKMKRQLSLCLYVNWSGCLNSVWGPTGFSIVFTHGPKEHKRKFVFGLILQAHVDSESQHSRL